MKVLILFLTFFSFSLLAQDQEEEKTIEDVPQREEQVSEPESQSEAETESKPQQQQDTIRVECVCPTVAPSEVQQEEAPPAIFPDNAVFNVTPAPSAQEIEEEKEEFNLPPGYIQKLPPGFSNDQYRQLGPTSEER